MKLINFFTRDYEKRCCFVFVILSILLIHELYYDVAFSVYVASLTKIEDLIELLSLDLMQKPFIGRVVSNYLTSNSFASALWQAINLKNTMTMLLTLAYLTALPRPKTFKMFSKGIYVTCLAYLVKVVAVLICVVFGLQAGSTAEGINILGKGITIYKYLSILVLIYLLAITLVGIYQTYIQTEK